MIPTLTLVMTALGIGQTDESLTAEQAGERLAAYYEKITPLKVVYRYGWGPLSADAGPAEHAEHMECSGILSDQPIRVAERIELEYVPRLYMRQLIDRHRRQPDGAETQFESIERVVHDGRFYQVRNHQKNIVTRSGHDLAEIGENVLAATGLLVPTTSTTTIADLLLSGTAEHVGDAEIDGMRCREYHFTGGGPLPQWQSDGTMKFWLIPEKDQAVAKIEWWRPDFDIEGYEFLDRDGEGHVCIRRYESKDWRKTPTAAGDTVWFPHRFEMQYQPHPRLVESVTLGAKVRPRPPSQLADSDFSTMHDGQVPTVVAKGRHTGPMPYEVFADKAKRALGDVPAPRPEPFVNFSTLLLVAGGLAALAALGFHLRRNSHV